MQHVFSSLRWFKNDFFRNNLTELQCNRFSLAMAIFPIGSKKLYFCGGIVTLCAIISAVVMTTLFRSVSSNSSEPNLEFVITVCRHGSRSPLSFYPNDPYNDTAFWPQGIKGALSNKGKQQMFQLGKNLRKRYSKLFPGGYKIEDIYVKSTQVPRTYMSVGLVLAAMFPPTGKEVWNSELLWQPIPIWPDTFDKTEITTNSSICPKFTQEQSQVVKDAQIYMKEHKDLFDYLTKHTGCIFNKIGDYNRVWDPISMEANHELPLPTWTETIYPEQMTEVASYMFKITVSGTEEMNRLVSGPLLKDFNSWITRKMNGDVSEKMLFHSGHDFTLIGLLSSVGFTEIRVVRPAASLMFEFYRSPEGRNVKMFYANDSTMEVPMQLNMPKCQDPCSLESFLKMTTSMETSDNYEAECSL